ncbi:IFNL3 protein, partial [Casuarius casuarius]|nr:IFNL3 protein [Casuarius casuarius]
ALLLLLLLALGPSLAGALPRGTPRHRSCGLSKYRFLLPTELKAVQKMKEDFVETMLLSDHKCNTRVFHRKWSTAELSVPDRMTLVEAELDLAMAILERPAASRLAETHPRPLAFLAQAREDLRGCSAGEAPAHQPSGKLRHWLHKLETAKQKVSRPGRSRGVFGRARPPVTGPFSPQETPGCLEASAILHLFQVLNDLKCTALREDCT